MDINANEYLNVYVDKLIGKLNEQTKMIVSLEVQNHFLNKKVSELQTEIEKLSNVTNAKQVKKDY